MTWSRRSFNRPCGIAILHEQADALGVVGCASLLRAGIGSDEVHEPIAIEIAEARAGTPPERR